MNCVFLSDEGFVEVFGVALESLLKCHKHISELRLFLIENGISDESKRKIDLILSKYNRSIEYIEMPPISDLLGTNLYIPKRLNVVDYARLFLAQILPKDLDKVLQLDCDLVIKKPLDELWETNLDDAVCAMINEGHSKGMRRVLGIPEDGMYFNSGVVLVDLEKWRNENLSASFVKYIELMNGYIPINAQGVMNAVMDGRIKIIPLKFNVHPLVFSFDYIDYLKLRRPEQFYSEAEYNEAKTDPYVIHYMTCFYLDERPWMEKCIHPRKDDFLEIRKETPWSGEPLRQNRSSKKRKLYGRLCHILPKTTMIMISSFIYVVCIPRMHERNKKKYGKRGNI